MSIVYVNHYFLSTAPGANSHEDAARHGPGPPNASQTAPPDAIEDQIGALRKELAELGLDAGASTIHYRDSSFDGRADGPLPVW